MREINFEIKLKVAPAWTFSPWTRSPSPCVMAMKGSALHDVSKIDALKYYSHRYFNYFVTYQEKYSTVLFQNECKQKRYETYRNVRRGGKCSGTSHLYRKQDFNCRYTSSDIVRNCLLLCNEPCVFRGKNKMRKMPFKRLLSGAAMLYRIISNTIISKARALPQLGVLLNGKIAYTSVMKPSLPYRPGQF